MDELVVLGTGGRRPTRMRAVSSYLLMSEHGNLLLDPGEGALRQLVLMGLAGCRVEHVFCSNHRLDHCLGLPSILQHLLDTATAPVNLMYPRESDAAMRHLLAFAELLDSPLLRPRPLSDADVVDIDAELRVRRLDHSIATLGFRWQPAGGPVFAFIPGTAPCDAAIELAQDADMLLCHVDDVEHRHAAVRRSGLMTAREAAEIASRARVRRLLLSHYQPRHAEPTPFLHEARRFFAATDVTHDLSVHSLSA
jgi:ribonuclease Z